jgi:hypothetical protein
MKILVNSGVAIAAMLLVAGSVSAADTLGVTYTFSAPSEGEFEDDVEQHEIKVLGMVPVLSVAEGGADIAIGARIQANTWTFDDDRIDDVDLYKLLFVSEIAVPIDAAYTVVGGANLGVHSDLEFVDEEDFRLEAHVMGIYAHSPTLHFALGVAFGEDFGDPQAFPLGGVYWRATDALVFNLIIPKPRVTYTMNSDLRFFVAAEPAGGQWNAGEEDEDYDFEILSIRAGVGAEYQVVDDGWLFAMVGSESRREVQIAKDEDELLDDDVELDDNAFFQIGFRLQ